MDSSETENFSKICSVEGKFKSKAFNHYCTQLVVFNKFLINQKNKVKMVAQQLAAVFSKLQTLSTSDHASVVSMNLFVTLLCACIVISHLLEENRWMNESITTLVIVSFSLDIFWCGFTLLSTIQLSFVCLDYMFY